MIYLELFLTFLEIGAFTFGGGYAMLPLIQQQISDHEWMTQDELINFIAVSESTPGSFAVNVSTYVGIKTAGLPGAFAATLGVVLPSFIVILAAAVCFEKFQKSKTIKGCMSGLKPAVIGLIASAVISTGSTVFFPSGTGIKTIITPVFISSLMIFFVMVILAFRKVHPIIVIVLSAVLGIGVGYILNL